MIDDGDDLTPDNDEDAEEAAPPKKKPAAAGGKDKDHEKRKRELITMGKAKGFLTYEEVNDHMPESIVSSDQIDDWLSTLGGEGIEIVDASTQVKVGEKRPPGAPAAAGEEPAADAGDDEEEEPEEKEE